MVFCQRECKNNNSKQEILQLYNVFKIYRFDEEYQ